MPLTDRLVHKLAIVTPSTTGGFDEYGQPVPGDPTTELLDGFLYPLTAKEIAQANQAGAELSDHGVIFAYRASPVPAAYVRYQPDDGERYEVKGTLQYNFGRDPLLLVYTRRVVSDALVVDSGVGS